VEPTEPTGRGGKTMRAGRQNKRKPPFKSAVFSMCTASAQVSFACGFDVTFKQSYHENTTKKGSKQPRFAKHPNQNGK
jgi:hypothetical protein